MGIVVTVFMGLGLLLMLPASAAWLARQAAGPSIENAIGYGLLLAGLWNGLWHGLRHLHAFWGVAAVFSGTSMVAIAVLQLGVGAAPLRHASASWWRRPAIWIAGIGLLASFLLYTVTLVRLNLGLPIIGP